LYIALLVKHLLSYVSPLPSENSASYGLSGETRMKEVR
jgi:hypothetical protein